MEVEEEGLEIEELSNMMTKHDSFVVVIDYGVAEGGYHLVVD